jgi:predicted Zn-dependent protease
MRMAGWSEEDVYMVADRAHSLCLQGRYSEARIVFEGLVVVDPENRYCRLALAAVCMAERDAAAALEQLSAWLERHPQDYEARARRCEAYLEVESFGETLEDWNLVRRGPATPYALRLQLRLQSRFPAVATLPSRTR